MPESELELTVSGGVGGLYANLDDLELLAHHSEELGADLAAVAAQCHALLADPDVLASAPLNPPGVVEFEAKLLAALDGPSGLAALAVELGGHAVALRGTATSYRVVDQVAAELIDAIRWSAGYAAGNLLSLPGIGMPAVGGLAGVFQGGQVLGVDWQELLTEHPGVVDTAVGMGPGLITGLPGPLLASDVPSGARLVGLLYPDGTAQVHDLGPDPQDPLGDRPPTGFEDLLAGLAYRNTQASRDQQGQIDVRVLSLPDGSRSFIVDIPGTKDWQPLPGRHPGRLNDLGTNLHAMGGETTAYQQGVVEALRRAGAGPDDPVMLVGHSQGGVVAAQTAADLAASGELNVTHVVTAGAPVGRVDLPDDVQLLALENAHDIAPHLDAAPNQDRPNLVTVTLETQHGSIAANHGIETAYLPAGAALDGSADPSVVAFRDSASAFFPHEGGTTTPIVYQIERSYPG